MANIYLDANVIVDMYRGNKYGFTNMLGGSNVLTSCLTIHILTYILKTRIPSIAVSGFVKNLRLIDFDKLILDNALIGPTDDFEDNIQLHSAVQGECDYFLTLDKNLLKLKYFGKVKICDKI